MTLHPFEIYAKLLHLFRYYYISIAELFFADPFCLEFANRNSNYINCLREEKLHGTRSISHFNPFDVLSYYFYNFKSNVTRVKKKAQKKKKSHTVSKRQSWS